MASTEQQQIQQLTERVVELEKYVLALAHRPAGQVLAIAPPVLAQPAEKVKKAKTEGPTLNKDGSERKKRTPGGWDLFIKEERAAVRQGLEVSGVKVKATEVAKELGRLWGELGDEGKAPWKVRAAAVLEAGSD